MASEKVRIKSEMIRRLDLAMRKRGYDEDKKLAEDADISPPTISGWRNGPSFPGKRNLKAVCKVLRIDPDWLTGKSNSDPNWDEPIIDHRLHPSDSVRSTPQICFQSLDIPFHESSDEWIIRQIEYFFTEIMNADDSRSRLTHIGTLVNLLKEMQDRLILEWRKERDHFPRAADILDKEDLYIAAERSTTGYKVEIKGKNGRLEAADSNEGNSPDEKL